jgi:prophage antirepressor-like protein
MDEIKILHKSTFLGKEIDVWGSIEYPLFRAKDVTDWLELKNTPATIKCIDEDERHKFNLGRNGGETWFLTEDGLYEVLMSSRKPIAKQFKKGVKKILHEIRTKGGYIATQQNDTPESIMARALKIADETLKRHEQKVRELETQTEQQAQTIDIQQKELTVAAPKVRYYDDTLASVDFVTTQQIANEIGMNANVLSKKLEEIGILYNQSRQWLLKMPYKTWNLHGTRTFPYLHNDGTKGSRVYTVWNQRGRRFILALYNNDFNVKSAIKDLKGETHA